LISGFSTISSVGGARSLFAAFRLCPHASITMDTSSSRFGAFPTKDSSGLRQEMHRQMAKTIPTTPFEWNRFRLAKHSIQRINAAN
jgi:hypothetical protein